MGMPKERRDQIEATLAPDRRFKMPPNMTDDMRQAAYRTYCRLHAEKGYIAWDDICKIIVAAFEAKR